jgi:hypothetical protein
LHGTLIFAKKPQFAISIRHLWKAPFGGGTSYAFLALRARRRRVWCIIGGSRQITIGDEKLW